MLAIGDVVKDELVDTVWGAVARELWPSLDREVDICDFVSADLVNDAVALIISYVSVGVNESVARS